MSHLTWEEKIEQQLNRIEKKLDALMGQGFEKPSVEKQTPKKTETDKDDEKWPPEGYYKQLTGVIIDNPRQENINTKNGPADITKFTLSVDDKELNVTAWGDIGEEVLRDYKVGEFITLTACGGRGYYKDKLQVSTTRKTKII